MNKKAAGVFVTALTLLGIVYLVLEGPNLNKKAESIEGNQTFEVEDELIKITFPIPAERSEERWWTIYSAEHKGMIYEIRYAQIGNTVTGEDFLERVTKSVQEGGGIFKRELYDIEYQGYDGFEIFFAHSYLNRKIFNYSRYLYAENHAFLLSYGGKFEELSDTVKEAFFDSLIIYNQE